jgi:hypothetical protein
MHACTALLVFRKCKLADVGFQKLLWLARPTDLARQVFENGFVPFNS